MMPTPQSAVEIEMMMVAFRDQMNSWREAININFFQPMLTKIMRRTFPQRPITDDMRQMLDDLGIDWPEHQPISYDGLTFRFRR